MKPDVRFAQDPRQREALALLLKRGGLGATGEEIHWRTIGKLRECGLGIRTQLCGDKKYRYRLFREYESKAQMILASAPSANEKRAKCGRRRDKVYKQENIWNDDKDLQETGGAPHAT